MHDEAIVAAIKSGDETAIHEVILKYSKLLWSIVNSILCHVASDQDVEECVADVFVHLWQNPDKFDPHRGRLKSWLSMVARSRAIDRYRELSRDNAVPLDDQQLLNRIDLCDEMTALETRQRLMTAVRSLPQPEQDILIRRYYYDQKPREISTALGLPVKQIENRLYQTKRRLRAMLAH